MPKTLWKNFILNNFNYSTIVCRRSIWLLNPPPPQPCEIWDFVVKLKFRSHPFFGSVIPPSWIICIKKSQENNFIHSLIWSPGSTPSFWNRLCFSLVFLFFLFLNYVLLVIVVATSIETFILCCHNAPYKPLVTLFCSNGDSIIAYVKRFIFARNDMQHAISPFFPPAYICTEYPHGYETWYDHCQVPTSQRPYLFRACQPTTRLLLEPRPFLQVSLIGICPGNSACRGFGRRLSMA